MPSAAQLTPLLLKAAEVRVSASRLRDLHVGGAMRDLMRAMNAYYSNRIEGHQARPDELAQALKGVYAQDVDVAARQRLAVCHVHAEQELSALFAGPDGLAALYDRRALKPSTVRCSTPRPA